MERLESCLEGGRVEAPVKRGAGGARTLAWASWTGGLSLLKTIPWLEYRAWDREATVIMESVSFRQL